jgi:hypothetical protein
MKTLRQNVEKKLAMLFLRRRDRGADSVKLFRKDSKIDFWGAENKRRANNFGAEVCRKVLSNRAQINEKGITEI